MANHETPDAPPPKKSSAPINKLAAEGAAEFERKVANEAAVLEALVALRTKVRSEAAARGVPINKVSLLDTDGLVAPLPPSRPPLAPPEPNDLPGVVADARTCMDSDCMLTGVVTFNEWCRCCRGPTAPATIRPPKP